MDIEKARRLCYRCPHEYEELKWCAIPCQYVAYLEDGFGLMPENIPDHCPFLLEQRLILGDTRVPDPEEE